jgi:hypothetical protein
VTAARVLDELHGWHVSLPSKPQLGLSRNSLLDVLPETDLAFEVIAQGGYTRLNVVDKDGAVVATAVRPGRVL